ncbi:MAG: GreA/GreB family elongation factor [Chloroflexota bacterium]
MVMDIEERGEQQVVQCPDCDLEITVDVDWQESDRFPCPKCGTELVVVRVDPIAVDYAPDEEDESWDDDVDESDDAEGTISLNDVEKMEAKESGEIDLGDTEGWMSQAAERAEKMRTARARQAAAELAALEDNDRVLLTPEGAARLRVELDKLKNVRLPKVTAWLSDALSEGFEDEDVTEMEKAREELSMIQVRINGLESTLAAMVELKKPENNDMVQLGSTVTISEGDQEPETYQLVTPAEADPLSGCISHVSPLGRELLGRQVGDEVQIGTPNGSLSFKVLSIE